MTRSSRRTSSPKSTPIVKSSKYPEGYCDWNLQRFPKEVRDQITGVAKFKGVTTPALVEDICRDWLLANVSVKDEPNDVTA